MKLSIHVHGPGGRVRTFDVKPLSLAQQYQKLVDDLLGHIDRQSTKDDAPPGHPFYGNQYTDVVLGPKPTEAKSKGTKNIVHELLTSGHVFTFEELKQATGVKVDHTLHSAISSLKHGNKAGGGLMIVKLGKDKYQVVKANGAPAPALPSTAETLLSEFGGPLKTAQEAPKDVPPPQPPAPLPNAAPSPVPASPSTDFKAVAKAPAVKMAQVDAEKVYTDSVASLAKQVADGYNQGKLDLSQAALLWKQGKSQAMAQWAANMHGIDHTPKPVDVFKADKKLVFDLVSAHLEHPDDPAAGVQAALKTWKSETNKAKLEAKKKNNEPVGQPGWSPLDKPTPPAHPGNAFLPPSDLKSKPAVLPISELAKLPVSIKAPEVIVPEGHQHISLDDFKSDGGEAKYLKNISDIHQKLHGSASDSVTNKKTVQAALHARLKDAVHFQNLQKQYKGTAHGGSLAAAMISSWAASSGGKSRPSVSAQLCCRDAFGMDPAHVETVAFKALHAYGGDEEAVHKAAAQHYGLDVSTPEKLASYKKGVQEFVLAQYHETQDHLAKLGIKELHLIRGMEIGMPSTAARKVRIKMQPASSFTTSHNTAKSGFAKGHSVFVVKVPASQVLGSFCTGYGCTGESEVVVLNHPGLESVQVGVNHAPTAATMVPHIHKELVTKSEKAAKKKKPASAAKSGPVFDPPPNPYGNSYAVSAYEAAKKGDLEAVKKVAGQVNQQVFEGANLDGTYKYVKELSDYVLKAHIQQHPQYNAETYEALSGLGHSDLEILHSYNQSQSYADKAKS